MSLLPKQYIDSVVSIGVKNKEGGTNWIGTGFFVLQKTNQKERYFPYLVTNKHVIENLDEVVIRMKQKDKTELANIFINLKNLKVDIHQHPNKEIDIVVISLDGKFIEDNGFNFSGFLLDDVDDCKAQSMNSSDLRNNGVCEGSLVYMLGFPLGLVNNESLTPICRLGCIARMDEIQIKSTYNMLIDIQNFPGNSGSPVVYRPEVVGLNGSKVLNRSVLIGIIHSYLPYKVGLIDSQNNQVVEIRSENSGLAYAHPVEYIKEIIDSIERQ